MGLVCNEFATVVIRGRYKAGSHRSRRLSSLSPFSTLLAFTSIKMATPRQEAAFFEQVAQVKKRMSISTGTGESMPGSPGSPESIATPDSPNVADSFVFAFDIDGVLVRGGKPIPEAIKAMQVLNGDNEYGLRM